MESTAFLHLLRSELDRRIKQNPHYSLRAFAGYLDIAPATLSSLLNEKRRLTPKSIKKLANKLGLSPKEISAYIPSELNSNTHTNAPQMKSDSFAMISESYHFAILLMMDLKDFRSDSSWIAMKLGLPTEKVDEAIERLKRLDMIKVVDNGRLVRASTKFISMLNEDESSSAAKSFVKNELHNSIKTVDTVDLSMRDHSGMMMTIRQKDIPTAKQLIKKFRREMLKLLNTTEDGSEIYQLAISLYPMGHQEKE